MRSWAQFRLWGTGEKPLATTPSRPADPYMGTTEPVTAQKDESLEDLDTIVNQPPPSLGAPAGVSIPILMTNDSLASPAICSGFRHRATRTLSTDIVAELFAVLAEQQPSSSEPSAQMMRDCESALRIMDAPEA